MIVTDFAKKFKQASKRFLFTTSTHLQSRVVNNPSRSLAGNKVFRSDFSEIEGFDNIRNPQSLFLQSQKQAAQIYDSSWSFYLYNGSTSGILALMLSVLNEGDKVLISANAHISVIQGLILSGASPVWLMPEKSKFGLFGSVNPFEIKRLLEIHKDIKAVILTSPTYEGIKSDIKEISQICHQKNALLLVDEAHGALWNFSTKLPETSIKEDADASVQSLHKNASALNQGAILHLSKSTSIDPEKVQQSLNLVCTTSPSFPILSSVESAVGFLNSKKGQKRLNELLDNVLKMREKLSEIEGVELLQNDDPTRIFLKIKGLSGYQLSEILFEKFRIEDELCNSQGILLVCGIGTTRKHLEYLLRSVKKISALSDVLQTDAEVEIYALAQMEMTPRRAFQAPGKIVKKEDALGLISKETITFYPPGIAVLLPGEKICSHHLKMIEKDSIEVVAQ